jgi:hypothetical protein
MVTVDAVAIGEIGPIRNAYLPTVRERLDADLGIPPQNLVVSASHCHGVARRDAAVLTVQAVKAALAAVEPVRIGAGAGTEDRITVNRRFALRDGHEGDERHAYSLQPDAEFADCGPVDPEIGVLRIDRLDGRALAVVYNFACHPIQGVPSGANTADITGFASQAIEDALGGDATVLFLQGCAGDVNPVFYKDVDRPRNGEPLGTMLAVSVLSALARIECRDDTPVGLVPESVVLPRADLRPHITELEERRENLLKSLRGTTLNLKTFLNLTVKYSLAPDCPSYYPHLYMHGRKIGRADLDQLDRTNRADMERYRHNVLTMEELTRVQANLQLLRMHQQQNDAAESDTVTVETHGIRIGDFYLVTFPGELSAQIGLNIKASSPHSLTFVATCTNGYIYYAPTARQLQNRGNAQEDSDCILAPEWQEIYEQATHRLLKTL